MRIETNQTPELPLVNKKNEKQNKDLSPETVNFSAKKEETFSLSESVNEGTATDNYSLDLEEIGEVEVPPAETKILPENLEESLNKYISVIFLALAEPNKEKQKSLFEQAGKLLADYKKLRADFVDQPDLKSLEQKFFNCDPAGQIILGDLKNPQEIQKELVPFAAKTLQHVNNAKSFEEQITKTTDPLKKEELELKRMQSLLQAQINQKVTFGENTTNLEKIRTDLNYYLLDNQVNQNIEKLATGKNIGEVRNNLVKLETEIPAENIQLKTKTAFMIGKTQEIEADNQVRSQNLKGYQNLRRTYESTIKNYEEIYTKFEKTNPTEAYKAKMAILSIEKKCGIFDRVLELEAKLKENPGLATELQSLKSRQLKLEQDTNLAYNQAIESTSDPAQKNSLALEKNLSLANFKEKQGNLQAAVVFYDQAGKFATDKEAKALINLQKAGNLIVLGKDEQALTALNQVKSQNYSSSVAYNQALLLEANLKLKAEDLNGAISIASQVRSNLQGKNDNEAKTLFNNASVLLAELSYHQGNLAKGDQLINEMVLANPKLENELRFKQGNAYLQIDRPEDAFKAFNKVLSTDPKSNFSAKIRENFSPYLVNGKLDSGQVSTWDRTWAAAQVALKESAGNSLGVSIGLAAGGAAAGAAVGVWFFGIGAVPGALIGAGVGTLIDRISGIFSGSEKISQAYNTGWEKVSGLENALNGVGLALDFIDIVPVGVFIGKTSKYALSGGSKILAKESAEELGSNVISKSGTKYFSRENLQEAVKKGADDVNDVVKLFDKAAKVQLAIGAGMVLGPGAIQVGSLLNDYHSGKISDQELTNGLKKAGVDTAKNLASITAFMAVMSGVNLGAKMADAKSSGLVGKIEIDSDNSLPLNQNVRSEIGEKIAEGKPPFFVLDTPGLADGKIIVDRFLDDGSINGYYLEKVPNSERVKSVTISLSKEEASKFMSKPTEAELAKVFPYNDQSIKSFVKIDGVFHRIKDYDVNTGLVKLEQTEVKMTLGNLSDGSIAGFPDVDSRSINQGDVIKDKNGTEWQVVSKTNINPFNRDSSNITLSRRTEIKYPASELLKSSDKLEKTIVGNESKVIAEKPKTTFLERLGYLAEFLTGDQTKVIDRIGSENIVSAKLKDPVAQKVEYPLSKTDNSESFEINQVDFTNLKDGDKFVMSSNEYTLEEKSAKENSRYVKLKNNSGEIKYYEKPGLTVESHNFSLEINIPGKNKKHSVEVYIPALKDGQPDLKMLEEVKKTIAEMPAEHVDALEVVRINPKDYVGGDLAMATASQNIEGKKRVMDIYASFINNRDSFTEKLVDVANHELGHLISLKLFDSFEATNIWDEAVRADGKHVSDYSKTNMAEDFAESVMYYLMTDGGRTNKATREQFSSRFKVLDELFRANIDQKYFLEQEAKRALKESGLIVGSTVIGVGGAYFLLDDRDEKK